MGRVYKVIDQEVHAKMMDFGIARSVRGQGLTDAGIAIGTSQYMSPEQAVARDANAQYLLTCSAMEAGRPDLAVKTFQRQLAHPAVASEPIAVLNCLDGVGRSFAAMGDVGKVRKTLDDVKAFNAGVFLERKNRTSLVLSGVLAATRRDGPAAVADLGRAVSMLAHQVSVNDSHTALLDLLGQAHTVAGNLAKARETYERIAAMTFDRVASGATWARSFYHLGLIAEKQGDKARAREQFRKFLEIWKDADKGLPEVADAKRRMGQ